ncbi:hypothetical protein GO730_37515 [Spirosoma sp. HMF3257]|uniref:hypothetical protein n=1 Tax=Spirosoma telluris TaxID=2183553 RepID=UPI0012F82789|nr:hypothetical protein [Spirosoma telluris]
MGGRPHPRYQHTDRPCFFIEEDPIVKGIDQPVKIGAVGDISYEKKVYFLE